VTAGFFSATSLTVIVYWCSMMGLQYLNVSVYQMLRGSGIIFVALMKQHVLKEHLVS